MPSPGLAETTVSRTACRAGYLQLKCDRTILFLDDVAEKILKTVSPSANIRSTRLTTFRDEAGRVLTDTHDPISAVVRDKTRKRQTVYLRGHGDQLIAIDLECYPVLAKKGDSVKQIICIIRKKEERKSDVTAHRQEELYRSMVDTMEDYAILLLDPEGHIENWNRGAERIKGFKSEEIVGRSFKTFYTAEDIRHGLPDRLLNEARRTGKSSNEGWRVKKDGSRFWATVVLTAIPGPDGEIIGFTKVTRDITQRRNAEERVLAFERKYHMALNSLGDMAWELDLQNNKTWYSEAIHDLLGFYDHEITDTAEFWLHQVHPDDRQRLADARSACEQGKTDRHHLEYRMYHKDGSLKWVLERGRVSERNAAGEPVKLIGTTKDITDRKKSEEALMRLQQQFQSFMSALPAMAWIIDEHGVFHFSNPLYNKTFHQGQQLEGKNLRELLSPELAHDYLAANKKIFDTLRVTESIDQVISPDGSKMLLKVIKFPLPFGGEPKTIGAIAMDITDRIEAEEALMNLNEKLHRSNRELEQFAYVASHDLQEPLRMVSSFLQLLEKKYSAGLDDTGRQYIEFAVGGAERMKALITDLLKLSRVSSAAGGSFAPVDINAVVRSMCSLYETLIAKTGATIHYSGLPTISGNRLQMEQLFQNLIGNALKYRGEKAPVIDIECVEEDNCWRFVVRDNGIGVDPRYAEKIFVIFEQLHGREEYAGTGIGLAVCRKIVELHGGRIWVESQPGEGAAFYFTIAKTLT